MRFLKSILLFCIEKWGFKKTLSWKNSILMYYIEKWCFRSQFFCFVLKNEEWEFLKTLSEKMLHSYVLYWKMMFLKSILLFCIEKWGFKKTLSWKIFLCIILKNDVFEVNSFVLYWKMRNEDFLKLFPKKCYILMFYIEKWGFWSQFFCFILKNDNF